MAYLVDTGVLLRLFDRTDPAHPEIRQALTKLRSGAQELVTTFQNVVEFWSVSTRPSTARGGYGHPVATIQRRVAFIERLCRVLPDDRRVYNEWKRLVAMCGVSGASVHDARIAATMLVYQITHLLTLNANDFHRYPGIVAMTPHNVAGN